MAKHLAQAVIAGVQVVGRAFAKAVRQEIAASQAAAARHGGGTQGAAAAAADARGGMTLEEARQVLAVEEGAAKELVVQRYEKLFFDTDKKNGGNLYLQSKVFRAKERLDEDLEQRARRLQHPPPPSPEAHWCQGSII